MNKIEEVKKLKQLLDDGIITEEDFAMQKQKIFSLDNKYVETDNIITEDTKSGVGKSLEDYEKELIKEANEAESIQSSNIDKNNDFYEKERLKEKAKLDAQEEIREKRNKKRKEDINKVVKSTIRGYKWVLSALLILTALGAWGASNEGGGVFIPIGVVFLLLGLMACPKITDYTIKYEKYTKFKKLIVIVLVILFVILCCI